MQIFRIFFFIAALLLPVSCTMAAMAQEQPEATTADPATDPGADPDARENYFIRIDLAQRVHELHPIRNQVLDVLELYAENLPPEAREPFIGDVMANINLEELETASVTAMADTFTAEELQTMIDYYSDPQSAGIESKSAFYRERIDPQIFAAIDRSLERIEAALAAQAAEIAPAAGE